MTVVDTPEKLTPKDYATDQDVRWCPGCGDYAILKAVQKTLADIEAKLETTVFVSGIGCAARFPYYIASYGFHTIHGRAPAVATGIKLANPELDVWVVGGDGDMLSIGGNHLMHALRRNVDLNLLLFNNEVYGLTKGQYSPTSRPGLKTPSTPGGSIDAPVNALSYALGAGARFVARGIDIQAKELGETLKSAHAHKGASLVEIIQNCVVFNDGAFAPFTDKKTAAETQVHVQHGQPLLFDNGKRGLRFNPHSMELETVLVGDGGVAESEVMVHDQTNRTKALMLAELEPPAFPVALGVLYCDPAATYDDAVSAEVEAAKAEKPANLKALLHAGNTWEVKGS